MSEISITSTCPRDCYDSCGLRIVVADGKVERVTGNAEHPVNRGSLCGKCALAYNGAWIDPRARLTTPLRRVGPKGEGRFEPIAWDEALAMVAGRLNNLIDEGRHRDILTAHYTGTCSVIANQFPMRLLNRIGATEVKPDSICNLSAQVALEYLIGDCAQGFDPRTATDARAMVVWGANPSASGPHADKHWLDEFQGELIVIDPVCTPTAARADLHLRPFPGTDAALAFGIMHELSTRAGFDQAFIAQHTTGFEALQPLIEAWPASRAAEVTGVLASDIERAAAIYGNGPSLMWLGQALCRSPVGGNAFRAAATLAALSGNIGRPGGGVLFLNGKGPTRGLDMGYLARGDLRLADSRRVSHMDLCEQLEAVPDGALVLWNINIAASNPDQKRLLGALGEPSRFTVVVDLFMTDSARYADVVLPAASFMEFDDLVGSYFHLSIGAQAKAVEPLGQALPNQEIFRRLARAMGRTEPELFESDEAILAHLLAPLDLTFDELKAKAVFYPAPEPVVMWAERSFPTPSGKIELASPRAAAAGDPLTAQPSVQARPAPGSYRLLTPADEWHMNSSYDNEPRIRARTSPGTVTMHPDDARRAGLADGEQVRVFNAHAQLHMHLRIDPMTPVGVLWAPKGRWLEAAPEGLNVNALNPGLRADLGASTGLHGVEVEVAR